MNHIVNNDSVFNEFILLEKPIDVKLDGRILKATKLRKINAILQNDSYNTQINSEDVLM